MKTFLKIAVVVLMLAFACSAQTAEPLLPNLYAGGVSFNNSGSPSIAGTGLYARVLDASSGTYAFTVYDAVPNSTRPLTVTSNISVGAAQKVFTIAGKIPVFVPTAAGVSFNGPNTGWAWSTGALMSIPVSKRWRLCPTVRIAKSSVSNGSGYQPIVGVLFGGSF